MRPEEHPHDAYTISTDKSRLNIPLVHAWLSQRAYWAMGRPLDVVERSIENSLCFGVYQEDQQVGFARVITDYATFSWLCDVFILESHRGRGLGKRLITAIVEYPQLQNVKRFLLATSDAHRLYARYGDFKPLPISGKWMVRFPKDEA